MSVAVMMGSKSDLPLMKPAIDILRELGIECVVRVSSAHRTPERTAKFAAGARAAGFKVLICAAGGAAHLAGVVSAHTTLPVIGVPLARTPLQGLDALYATVQMPTGMPVATVAVDGAANAALLAAHILSVEDAAMEAKLVARRRKNAEAVAEADAQVEELLKEL